MQGQGREARAPLRSEQEIHQGGNKICPKSCDREKLAG